MMANEIITYFELDQEKLAILGPCIDNYGIGSPDAEWPNNIISQKTVVYQSGVIARNDSQIKHLVNSTELALCQQLAAEAENIMDGVEIGMGSNSSDQFHGFYIAANIEELVSSNINEKLIRSKFGGTIFPSATITVESLTQSGEWWAEVEYDGSESDPEYFKPWNTMIEWFNNHRDFIDSSFVRIGDRNALLALVLNKDKFPEGTEAIGCVLPRLALGLTSNGSLVGLFGYTVQT
jgi:hypothetical protein